MSSYQLKYNDFHSNISENLCGILASSNQSDIILAVDGKFFKAHQLILAFSSPYFRELFDVNGGKPTILYMRNVKHSIIQNLLMFMYTGEVQVPVDDINLFMETASELQIKGLTNLEPSANDALETDKGVEETVDVSCALPDEAMESDEVYSEEVEAEEEQAVPEETEQTPEVTSELAVETAPEQPVVDEAVEQQTEHIEVDLSLVKEEPLEQYILTFDEEENVNSEVSVDCKPYVNGTPIASEASSSSLLESYTRNETESEFSESENGESDIDVEEPTDADISIIKLEKKTNEDRLNLREGEPILVTLGCLRKRKEFHTLLIHENYRYVRWPTSQHLWQCEIHAKMKCEARVYIIGNRRIAFANAHNHGREFTTSTYSMIYERHIFYYLPLERWKRMVALRKQSKSELDAIPNNKSNVRL